MISDGLQLLGVSTAMNFKVEGGTTLPSTASQGQLFFLRGTDGGMKIYDGSTWKGISGDLKLDNASIVAGLGYTPARLGTDGKVLPAQLPAIPDLTSSTVISALGYTPARLVNNKIDFAQLPAIAITDTFVVASQAAMLALGAERGDVAIRTDLSKSFILKEDDATQVASWQELLSQGGVTSVNNKVGQVVLTTADITEGANLYYTDARARSAISVTGSGGSYNAATGVITLTGSGGDAGTLTGTTLASNVVNSSLTTLGRLSNLTLQASGSIRSSLGASYNPADPAATALSAAILTIAGVNGSYNNQAHHVNIQGGNGDAGIGGAGGAKNGGNLNLEAGAGGYYGGSDQLGSPGGDLTLTGGRAGQGFDGSYKESSSIIFNTYAGSTRTQRLRITGTGALSLGTSNSNYGSSGQVLTSSGNGVPTWTTPATTTSYPPAGGSGYLQFNNNGQFGASSISVSGDSAYFGSTRNFNLNQTATPAYIQLDNTVANSATPAATQLKFYLKTYTSSGLTEAYGMGVSNDSGFWSHATDQNGNGYFAWSVGNTEKMRLTKAGVLSATSFSGSGASLTGIPNTALIGTNGTAGQALINQGPGAAPTWGTVTAQAAAAGANTQFQINNNGAIGAANATAVGNKFVFGAQPANNATATPSQIALDTSYTNSAAPTNQQLKLSLGNFSSTACYGWSLSNDAGLWAHVGDSTQTTSGYYAFAVAGSEKMRLTAAGYMLLGTSADVSDPGANSLLQIVRNANVGNRLLMVNTNTGSSAQADISFRGASGSTYLGQMSAGGVTDAAVVSSGLQSNDSYYYTNGNQRACIFTKDLRRFTVTTDGNLVVGYGALATNATNGFLHITASAGAPTGAPTLFTGRAPIHVDTTNNRFYFYSNGWKAAGNVTNGANTFTAAQVVTPTTLTDAASIAIDASLSNNFRVTLGGNRGLANPTNLVDGQVLNIRIAQDATGGRNLSYGSMYKFSGGNVPSTSPAPNSVDFLTAVYDAPLGILICSMNKDFR
jgi:hypothetical protein